MTMETLIDEILRSHYFSHYKFIEFPYEIAITVFISSFVQSGIYYNVVQRDSCYLHHLHYCLWYSQLKKILFYEQTTDAKVADGMQRV